MKVIEILEAAKYDTCNEVKAEFGFKTNHMLKCLQRSLISK